uniref:PiggyBac transposable element-derived protein domain-containing protein n=1 Tax=Odontella aurita TaxID=265563 RepID=A0A7S4J171_9STRA
MAGGRRAGGKAVSRSSDVQGTLLAPSAIECKRGSWNRKYQPVHDLDAINVNRRARFVLPWSMSSAQATAENLLTLLIPDAFIGEVARLTNAYTEWRLPGNKRQRAVTEADIIKFFALIYYLGVVKLPDKRDLWSTHSQLPVHSLASENSMTRDRFQYVWRNISFVDGGDAEAPA